MVGSGALSIYLIKPTRYDDDGYPVQWWRSIIPANSLACVTALTQDSLDRGVLGDTPARLIVIDEINTIVRPDRIVREIRESGGKAVVFLVGVQTNQFPRAVDIARPLRAAGVPVCIGGFHVSGCLSMLDEMPVELKEAQSLGISFFAGEAEEGRLDEVLLDAKAGALKAVYNHLKSTPNLAGAPTPYLAPEIVAKTMSNCASFDLGRGCPFECSFCTIINVQGRKSRFRTVEDLERIIRDNARHGIRRYFVTDDNFARNKNWKPFLETLARMRREEGVDIRLIMQVDTLAHHTPGFIDACVAAGLDQLFVGLENINSDNLQAVKKRQNRVEEYREMFLAWKQHSLVIICGYIIGFPHDTKASILHDIEILKRELPIDILYLNYLTPLPGSEDHRRMVDAGTWMDGDMNKYDLNHRVAHHPVMSDEDWESAYREAHASFYSFDHMRTVIRRMAALGSNMKLITCGLLTAYREIVRLEGVAKLEGGLVRIKDRRQRRPGRPIESPLVFYPKYLAHLASTGISAYATWFRLKRFMRKTVKDPARFAYVDAAIAPVGQETQPLHLLDETRGADFVAARQARTAMVTELMIKHRKPAAPAGVA
ncbi:B12-binding domain-containing radical SAM protein [Phenylobacterium montanum]|uniref:Radical SAM protein n=1 Tax=Phenylobacterium montanum TaxID=2823693 RepID=A0A975G2T4_9CAUL|nr:radical SAM protein [Caulobacter sp. S6]QUD90095.1 radical SAM protein [Caulobacter sp. S6]